MAKRSRGKSQLTEWQIIDRLTARFTAADHRVLLGLGDDAAVLRSGGASDSALRLNLADLVVTTDLLIEGVHFSLDYMSLADVGFKALAVNLSDIAAMGAMPSHAFGQLGVPRGTPAAQLEDLLDGVMEAATLGEVTLAGGDTVAAPQWTLGFTVHGEMRGEALKRSGARPGDTIWHSGSLGLSQIGFHYLWSGAKAIPSRAALAHRRPVPQLALGSFLHESGLATACLDLSDSLSQCLVLLAQASGVGLMLDFHSYAFDDNVQAFISKKRRWLREGANGFSVPAKMNPAGRAQRFRSWAEFILSSAEDYELLFTVPPPATARLLKESPVPLTRLGTVVDQGEGLHYRAEDGRTMELTAAGFEHL